MSSSTSNPATAPAILNVDLKALRDNYRLFRGMAPQSQIAGVLKANAYGIGADAAFSALRREGCELFFTATPDEALSLRRLDPAASLAVLGGLYQEAVQTYHQSGLIPVLNAPEDIERWAGFAGQKNEKLPAILHLDTGMNRLGLGADELLWLEGKEALLNALDLKLVMTHLACSDEKDHAMNVAQAARFAQMSAAFAHVPKSLCNSSGLFRDSGWHYDVVRPGYALYGGNPTPETTNPVRRVVGMSVRILQIRLGKKGETIGYGASHRLERDTPLATVALGYADGFLRAGSNKAKLFWQGAACPVLGRVSMDLTVVSLGGITDAAMPTQGAFLELLGPHQDVDALAADCGTIGYEILTSLSRRCHRIYEA